MHKRYEVDEWPKWLLLLISLLLPSSVLAADQIICCGGPEVFIIPADAQQIDINDRIWRWRAADSPEIPVDMHKLFRTTDDCKPVDDAILISASSGGFALVRFKDKKCLFYTVVKNAHSGCIIPGQCVAVASSFGGDEVLLFGLDRSGTDLMPKARFQLAGAHGVVWDRGRQRLWALGSRELFCLDV